MAGFIERPKIQPPTAEARNRAIGNYYLSLLLKRAPELNDKRPFSLAHRAIISDANLASIPPSLINQLGLEDLEWTWCGAGHMNSLPILRIGRPIEDGYMTTDVNKATATIEVARRIDLSQDTENIVPFTMRFGGVIKDDKNPENNRAVALSYDLENGNRLTEVNVSISGSEFIAYAEKLSRKETSEVIVGIPTDINQPYETAGLITEGMYNKINEPSVRFAIANGHGFDYAAIFKIGKNSSIIKKAGYYEERQDGIVTVGLKKEIADKEGLLAWKFSVPEFLQKA